ncbi:MAG: amino acid permease, partial [Haemophilus parainfluenzae]|nr:amino acid permease [Haemophilus parainfluenzae]
FTSSAEEGYLPAFFKKVTSKDAPIVGMVTITSLQTLLSLMTISPSLNKQFNVLVDLAVVTNVIPYLLSMAALAVLLKTENVPHQKYKKTVLVAFIGSVYSIYALYAAGEQAMLYGSIVTFIGWTLYGFVSYKFDLKKSQA